MTLNLQRPDAISIVVTTYGTDTYYTQACLESIRRWKNSHHELIVVSHDESALLRAYLNACFADGLIDKLLWATPGHGHTRGFNLAYRNANAQIIFNICNDILIGPSLVDDCAYKLRNNRQLGLIGWHWYNEGTFWNGDTISEYKLRDDSKPFLSEDDQSKMRSSKWHTGRAFKALDGPKWLCLCNTGFFGARKEVIDRIGEGFSPEYHHYFADDALNYAVLDLGLDIHHFEAKFRQRAYFHEFQYDNIDVPDRHRHDDMLQFDGAFLDSIRLLGGGMSEEESIFLYLLAKSIPNGATVTNTGVWRGSSAIVLMDALKDKRIHFNFIDCFDLPRISNMSGQGPVSKDEFQKYIDPYIACGHTVHVTQANTLEMNCFPVSDFVFLDAGHTEECIRHDARLVADCLTPNGVAVFHDYGSSQWPSVKPELDKLFIPLKTYRTMAVFQTEPKRVSYEWK